MNKYVKIFVLFVILSINLMGCASMRVNDTQGCTDEVCLHQLYIDANGDLLNPVTGGIVLDESAYIQKIFNNFDAKKVEKPKMQLTVFIHGGLYYLLGVIL